MSVLSTDGNVSSGNSNPALWAELLENDVTGGSHLAWLEQAPWHDRSQESTRLIRLNTDSMAPWIQAWHSFGCNQTSDKLLDWAEAFPEAYLWINFNNADYVYAHYVDNLVHAAAHQNLTKFSAALSSKNDNRNLTENLPPWAAVSALQMMFSNPSLTDTYPDVVSELCALTRMLANAGTSTERRRFAGFMEILVEHPELQPMQDYVLANSDLVVPFELDSELELSKYFPLGIYISAVYEREVSEDILAMLRTTWPAEVQHKYQVSVSLGDDPINAAKLSWGTYRALLSLNTVSNIPNQSL